MRVICIGLLTKEDMFMEYDLMMDMEEHALSEIKEIERLDISCHTQRFDSPSDETIQKINQYVKRIYSLYPEIPSNEKFISLYLRPQSNVGQISAYQLGYIMAYWQWHDKIDCQAFYWNNELHIWESI